MGQSIFFSSSLTCCSEIDCPAERNGSPFRGERFPGCFRHFTFVQPLGVVANRT